MQVFFILFSVHFAVYQYINSKCLYRTHVKLSSVPRAPPNIVAVYVYNAAYHAAYYEL